MGRYVHAKIVSLTKVFQLNKGQKPNYLLECGTKELNIVSLIQRIQVPISLYNFSFMLISSHCLETELSIHVKSNQLSEFFFRRISFIIWYFEKYFNPSWQNVSQGKGIQTVVGSIERRLAPSPLTCNRFPHFTGLAEFLNLRQVLSHHPPHY